ncbi:helix-turn-helix transcriptional regulator [Aestuariirhabdus litorea]|uniref:WYL domain-containing protein n=1 Tax=Aestuariirhabdus litorea TaxID=2528527 RepID=A0A3P3VRX1_9GAMM|nr:WYL domain-containing protein [Aestuariirhabdus litorea]RRJ84259.1 WYL domain-containing protein [Aestuariirhabdus litorea]RWW97481.1 WYL domain-containing protein [Endozoicomonadaceae bacterium GTF-13]
MTASPWPYRWDLLQRYRLIEIVALWEGRLTTNHLVDAFGIGRQQASKDINTYKREIAPDNLEYDQQLKGYRPSPRFQPHLTCGTADEYLQLLNRNRELSSTFEAVNIKSAHTEVLSVPARAIEPEVLRTIVAAARYRQRIEVDYVSVSDPNREGRIITPHTLVYNGMRWHVRAWCEKHGDYRDFVLSRFRGSPEVLSGSEQGVEGDSLWNRWVTIRIRPDTRLTPEQRKVVARDYGMRRNLLSLKTRAALVQYALKLMQLDPYTIDSDPRAQQIVISNLAELKPYLFG